MCPKKANQIREQKTSVLAPILSPTAWEIELQAYFHSIQETDLRSGGTLSSTLTEDNCKI